MNCAAQTIGSSYSSPARCAKNAKREATTIQDGSRTVRVKLCAHHRRMVKDGRTVELAR